jgi:hypothetical protein
MDGLEMSSDILAARERATYAPLDNPDRRHESDGFGLPNSGIALPNPALVEDAPQKVERQSVLVEAQGLVHGGRNDDYGHPLDDWSRTAAMVSAMLAHKLREPLTAEDALMLMVCVKLSREVNRPKRDNRTDGAGYFECLDWVVDERARRG